MEKKLQLDGTLPKGEATVVNRRERSWFVCFRVLLCCLLIGLLLEMVVATNENNPPIEEEPISTSGNPPGGDTTSDPINILDGTMILDETDLVVKAPQVNLEFSRVWMSTYDEETDLGDGWSHTYDWRLNRGQTNLSRIYGTYLGTPGYYMILDAPASSLAGKYKGGKIYFREVIQTNSWPQWEEGTMHIMVMPSIEHFFVAEGVGTGGAYLYMTKDGDGNVTDWALSGIGGDGRTYHFDQSGYLSRIEYPNMNNNGNGVEISLYNDGNGRLGQVYHSGGASLSLEYDATSGKLRKVTTDDPNLWVEYSRTNYSSGDYTKRFRATRHISTNALDNLDFMYYYQGITNTATGDVSKEVIVKKVNPVGDEFNWSYSNSSDYGLMATGNWVALASNGGQFYNTFLTYGRPSTNVGTTTMTLDRANGVETSTTYTHDMSKMVTTNIVGPLEGQVEKRIYDSSGNLLTNRFEQGADYYVIKKVCDSYNNPTNIYSGYNTARYGLRKKMTWNSLRQLTSVRDSMDRGYGLVYSNALPIKIEALASGTNKMTLAMLDYDDEGKLVVFTNANNHVSTIRYESTSEYGATKKIVFSSPFSPSLSRIERWFYTDDQWRLKGITEFDEDGNLFTTLVKTDYAGRPLVITNALNQVSSFSYDKLGRLTYAEDAGGRYASNTWKMGKRVSTTVGKTGTTNVATITFDYDPQMSTLWIKDPLNRIVEGYSLDAAGQATSVTNVDSRVMTIVRGVLGMVKSISRFDGTVINFVHDSSGRLTAERYANHTNKYEYLSNGLLSALSTGTNRVSFAYDQWNRLTNASTLTHGLSSTSAYLFDNEGNLITQSNIANISTNTYNENEQLLSANYANQNIGSWEYSYGEMSGVLRGVTNAAAALSTQYEYDLLGRVTNIVYTGPNGVILRSVGYGYDASGLITNKSVNGSGISTAKVSAYEYDALGQLILERTSGLVTNSYSYNLAGNRTTAVLKGVSSTYTTPATHNRLASWTGGGGMAYNTEGCVTQLNRANKADMSSLSWNAEYQLTGTTVGGVTVSYTYDVLGRKASRTMGSNTEYYIYDGIDLVAEIDGTGNVARTYTYGPGVDDILAMTIHGSSGATNYYYLKDLSNTVLALANSSGSIVESYFYDAYGNVTIRNGSGTVISSSTYGNRFLFQGREYDYTTQLYHFRARWYDPETGRWLSNDPIGISGGLNLYAFCGNDPVNYVDPMGLAIVKNRTGRPILVSGNMGNGQGSGDQYYGVIPPSEDEACGGFKKPISVYSVPGEAIASFLGCPITPEGNIKDIDFVVGYADGPYNMLNFDTSTTSSAKIFGNDKSPTWVLTQDDLGNIVKRGDGTIDSLMIGGYNALHNEEGPRYYGYGGRLPF